MGWWVMGQWVTWVAIIRWVTWVMGQWVLTHDPSFFQYLERIQALSIILEGYKNNLKKSNVNS